MHFCRSISSLGVGTIEKELIIADGFSASGIRGLRYLKENDNVLKCIFIDCNENAIHYMKSNIKKNKLTKKSKVISGDFNRKIREFECDLIEIDPFGSPVPYLFDSIRSIIKKKKAFLSITATDTAVLCGPHSAACMKNYHSKSLNNEFTHESGIRILIKRVLETCLENNFGVSPMFSLSDQHYFKLFLELKKGDDYCLDSISKIGYTSFCTICGNRTYGKIMQNICECGNKMVYAGPIWTGELHNPDFISHMLLNNKNRDYFHKQKLDKILNIMKYEFDFPPYFYDLHQLSRFTKNSFIPKTEFAINKIIEAGYKAVKTHFLSSGIKTDAKIGAIKKILYP